jgi:hypothetical protein
LETNPLSRSKEHNPKSLGQLAGRISAWTTRGLLSGMLLVMALVFGREVLHWWRRDSPQPARTFAPWGEPSAVRDLEFADQSWSIRRLEFAGPAGGAALALQEACRAAIAAAHPRGATADAAEREMLKRLARERPVAEMSGQWRLYQWGAGRTDLGLPGIGNPILVGTRATLDKAAPGTILDETAFRVVIWGIAVPAAEKTWTMYLFQAGGTAGLPGSAGPAMPVRAVALPPDGQRLLAIRSAGGGAITAFTTSDGSAARQFYDGWFAAQGWTATAPWQQIAAGWQARFETRSGGPALAADIRLGTDSQGKWSGLIMESELERTP